MDLDVSRILLLSALTNQSGSGIRFWNIGKELAQQEHCAAILLASQYRCSSGALFQRSTNSNSAPIGQTGYTAKVLQQADTYTFELST